MVGEYGYHGTQKRKLRSIARDGLVPMVQPEEHADEDREDPRPGIYFSPTEQIARNWGGVVLRFPFPEDAEEDYYGDSLFFKGAGVLRSSYIARHAISPELIEVKIGRRWVPLVS